MTQEVLKLTEGLDINTVEIQMALHCAPLLAGLKMSNLLIVQKGQAAYVQRLLHKTKLSCYFLAQKEQKVVLLLYKQDRLQHYLENAKVKELLKKYDYPDTSFHAMVKHLTARYKAYIQYKEVFPHEIGLFLGYPYEDVAGFIANKGEHSLYTGYWKVYHNKSEKLCLFSQYDTAQEILIRHLALGNSITDILYSI